MPGRKTRGWVAVAALLLCGRAGADGLLQGALGRWLDDEVAPPLAEVLSRHPRFQGETVRLTVISPDAPAGTGNRLAEAVEARMRQRLLAVEGVRLAAEQPRSDCEPPPAVGYLVRIEVSARGGRNARVDVAVVDVAESVWVSGISHQWQGRLSAAERDALAAPVAQAAPGSAGSPIPLAAAGDVAQALKADLACLLPRDLDGAVFLAAPESDALARVALALQSELRYEPYAVLTADREQARWLLSIDADAHGADVGELRATLAAAGGGSGQQVGSVFVAGAIGGPPPAVAATPEPAALGGADLLSPIAVSPARREGVCDDRKARVNACAEVAFELRERAYLFVVSTQDHVIAEAPCAGLSRVEPGERRFRLRIAPGGYAAHGAASAPDAGFYVLAVRERGIAAALQRTLAAAPGACGGAATGAAAAPSWVTDIDRLLDEHGAAIAWRAVHLVHGPDGIAAL